MSMPSLQVLPEPSSGRTGWPWTEATVVDFPEAHVAWPRISIVVPSYNQGAFLEEALRSMLLQSYPDLEVIVIDGGSTDASQEILERYSPWITYWESQADRGQSHAINKGLKRCTGDVITFFSSDDFYLPGTFLDVGRRRKAWREHGALVGSFFFVNEQSEVTRGPHPPQLPGPGPHDLSLGVPYRLHQVATFYNQAALDAVGRHVREDLALTMDRDLLYRVCKQFPVYLVEQPYASFRRHEDAKSGSNVLAWRREYAKLALLHSTGEEEEDRLRRNVARREMAKGYLSYATQIDGRWPGIRSLLVAARYHPRFLGRLRYWVAWLDVLGIGNSLRALRRLMRKHRARFGD